VVEAAGSMAAVAVASMEAVEVATFREVAGTFRVAGGTTAPQAGGLSMAAGAIVAVHRRQRTEADRRMVDRTGRAREQIVT
jgi:hypothetical protein